MRNRTKKILRDLGCNKDTELSILFVDDDRIRELNKRFLKRDGTTNVISFPMQNGKSFESQTQILGDVVISVDRAERDAKKAGLSLDDELSFLLIHGILHLLGYDHIDSEKKRREMREKEEELFLKLHKKIKYQNAK